MAHFVIQTDGERGVLLVDGEQPEPFGALVAVEVHRNLPLGFGSRDWLPHVVQPREQPAVEVTLRLPIGPRDTLTVVRGNKIEDVQGPTADHVPDASIGETGWRPKWDEEYGVWRPTVGFAGLLPGTLAGSLQGYGFASKADCLTFLRDHLDSLGRMHPTADGGQDVP